MGRRGRRWRRSSRRLTKTERVCRGKRDIKYDNGKDYGISASDASFNCSHYL